VPAKPTRKGTSPLVLNGARRDHRVEMRLDRTLVAIALLVSSCNAGGSSSLTESNSGSEVRVDAGDVIEVMLEENPSTGYTWELSPVPEMLQLTDDEYVAPETDRVGAPGTRQFRFATVSAGAGILRFEYIRPFDESPVAERIVEYVVIVGDAAWPPVPAGSPPATSTATAP
jgi:inhibitor of cysteine peptidase